MKDYYEKDAVSATLLKAVIKQSPVHAEERMKSFVPTANMKLGTAFHAVILEPEIAHELYAVQPIIDRRTKAGKEVYASFLENVGDKAVITQDQSQLLAGMKASCLAHPEVRRLMEQCYATEFQSFFEFSGIECKAMIDICDDEGTIVDIKTTQDASPVAFMRQSANLLYHLQLAWYAKSIGRSWKDCDCYVIAVENTPPHSVAVYHYEPDALEYGWRLCKRAVRIWKDYLADVAIDGKSFAYGTDAIDLVLPVWAERI